MFKSIIVIVFTAIVFTIVGFILATKTSIPKIIFGDDKKESEITAIAQGNNFQDGWYAAKKRFQDSGFYSPAGNETKTINGQIVKIEDDKIAAKINPIDPFDDIELDNRNVLIGSQTKIYQIILKEQSVYDRELAEYNKLIEKQAGKMSRVEVSAIIIEPPSNFIQKEISKNEIKADQRIIASSQDNIRTAKEFVASEIIIQNTE